MKLKIHFLFITLFSAVNLNAQLFINKAVIEYEMRANIQKTMGNNFWEEMLKENLPTFKTGYYTFTFADNKSIYKFDHWDEKAKLPDFLKKSDEENVWFYDYNTGKFNIQKTYTLSNIFVTAFLQLNPAINLFSFVSFHSKACMVSSTLKLDPHTFFLHFILMK